MRLATFTRDVELIGGADRSLLTMLRALASRSISTVLVADREGKLCDIARELGIDVIVTHLPVWTSKSGSRRRRLDRRLLRLGRTAFRAARTASLLRRRRVDVVYTNNSMTAVGALAAKLLGAPHVWHLREFPLEQFEHPYDLGTNLAHRWILGLSGKVVCASKALKQYVAPHRSDKIEVVYNGVVSSARLASMAQHRSDLGDSSTPLHIAYVSNFSESKNQLEAVAGIRTARALGANVRLRLYGAGNRAYQQEVENAVRRDGLGDEIALCGYTTDPFAAYEEADVALTTSRWEGFGRTTAEAMCVGRPVVGANTGATPELIGHNERGIVYQEGDLANLGQCIYQLHRDRGLVQELGTRAFQFAKEWFSIERYARTMLGIVTDALH